MQTKPLQDAIMLNNEERNEMLICEAFLRRASAIDLPFMLKGSYVTRQYFDNPNDRIPVDLDWVYLETLKDVETSRHCFNEWTTRVTEATAEDGIVFTSFTKNAFWRRIDYAMSDDFPTVNTDLSCSLDGGADYDCSIDISFNLDIEVPPVPMLYRPLRGKPFVTPRTVPLPLQVSWKLHQTIVRPRFKDIFDLIHLLRHPAFDSVARMQCLQALVNECSADNVDMKRLEWLLTGDEGLLFPGMLMQQIWNRWRHEAIITEYIEGMNYDIARHITDPGKLPEKLLSFLDEFRAALHDAGLTPDILKHLPDVTRRHRKTYGG
jgi:Nucleotidyl transferase AbiEii toxin, Type IV TA system